MRNLIIAKLVLVNKWLVAAFIFCALLALGLSAYLMFPVGLRTVSHQKYAVDYLDTRQSKPNVVNFEMHDANNYGTRELSINFSFKVYKINSYDNIFQTDAFNNGLRMEVTAPATLALIVPGSGASPARGIFLSRGIEVGEWYRVSIVLWRDRHLTVLLNNRVAAKENIPALASIAPQGALGTGFGKTRMFDGVVSGFTVELVRYAYVGYKKFTYLFFVCKRLIFILFLILACSSMVLFWQYRIYVKIIPSGLARIKRIFSYLTENILLAHFIVCSFSLLCVAERVLSRFLVNFTDKEAFIFNKWALAYIVPNKTQDLIAYAVMIVLLFIYYLLFLMLKEFQLSRIGYRFRIFWAKMYIGCFFYLFFLVGFNIVVVRSFKHFSPFQSIVWLLGFTVPLLIPLTVKSKQ